LVSRTVAKEGVFINLGCIELSANVDPVTEITAHPADLDPWNYLSDPNNQPFALAGDKRSVIQILQDAETTERGDHKQVLASIKHSIAGHFRFAHEKAELENVSRISRIQYSIA